MSVTLSEADRKTLNKGGPMSKKPILRDAETKDMGSMMHLIKKLIDHEAEISSIPLIEDKQQVIMETVARALVDPEQHAWVVEKSGRILGIFMVTKETRFTANARNPVCIFTNAYSQKTVLSFYEVHNQVKKWAKEKDCKAIQIVGLTENKKMQHLCEGFGYTKAAVIYEMEV